MARWNIAVAVSNYGHDGFPGAGVTWVRSEGIAGGLKGYATFDDALSDLMNDGWEPFSAHRLEDTPPAYEPYRDYVWFRREIRGAGPATRVGPVTTEGQTPKRKP